MDADRAQLQSFDQDIANAIRAEERRQSDGVEMIPSENYTYPEVLAALGSVLTTSIQRDIRAGAITAVRNIRTSSRTSHVIARARFSEPNTPMCSRCPDRQ